METPFVFGKLAQDEDFTDRQKELVRLTGNFRSGINTILISPRRWGKTSLVSRAAKMATKGNRKILVVSIDLFNIRSETEFYQVLAQEVIRASSTKWDERVAVVREFMSRFIPKISYSPDPNSDFSVGLDWKEVRKSPDEIIDLAESIASKRKIRIVVCIDEFQNITSFEEQGQLQKKLRSHWQKHKNVSYCLYGSRRQMMLEVFTSPGMPFYKFGDLFLLEKINEQEWVEFIRRRFSQTGRKISDKNASLIANSAENHPYYVQQLAQLSWLRTQRTCSEEIILEALDSLLMQLSLLFQNLTDSLATTQVNFLKAILEESESLSSKENLLQYKLGTSANVIRIREALLKKEIIDYSDNKLDFLDPMYKKWLKKYYFKIH